MTAISPRLAVGKTVKVTTYFTYDDSKTEWGIGVGDRLVILARRGNDWRVRCGVVTFNIGSEMLARVTATEGK